MEHLMSKFRGTTRQSFRWYEARWSYRVLATALASLMPAAIGSFFLFAGRITLLQFGVVWLSCLVESFLFLWLVHLLKPGRRSIVITFFIGVLVFPLWIQVFGLQWRLLFIPILMVIVVYRMQNFVHSDSIVQSHRDIMLHDFIAVFGLIVLLGWLATSSHGITPDVRKIVLFSAIAVLAGRICLGWGLERMDSIATDKSPLFSLYYMLFIIVGIFVLLVPDLFTLFVQLLALILSGLFLIVYKPILWLLSLIVRHRPKLALSTHSFAAPISEQAQTGHHPWASMAVSQHIIDSIRFLAILICVSVLLIYIYKKWIIKERVFNHKQEPLSVSRTWIWRKKRLTFEQTDDDERIRYQKWLFEQHGKGYTIRDDETAQEFLIRLQNDEQSETLRQRNYDITQRYERIRFGSKNDW